MSTSTVSVPFLVPPPAPPCTAVIRRRPNQQQGRALEMLGHAIEYLVDSRMFLVHERNMPAESSAVQILSRASREVFATCAEIVPVRQRLKLWAALRLRMASLPAFGDTTSRRV
ncbi:hypothetical protein [Granulicella arctica]|uniref:Uncharacterized protein n=1 Tax=Granulicella arctica TaxID=940613 RepID=A0A7Y9THD9_9BACT|nr:hypothetical protein [Granulicella arctica]NYF80424.1 hypothetical protein [Granulicella arctica]